MRCGELRSLGVMLYIMIFGGFPYEHAGKRDPKFSALIKDDYLAKYVKFQGLEHRLTMPCLDILISIFKPEKERININQLKMAHFSRSLGEKDVTPKRLD